MRNTVALRWRAIGLLVAVFVVVALTYFVMRNSASAALEAATWVNHSAEVKSVTYQIANLDRNREAAVYRVLDGEDLGLARAQIEAGAAQIPALLRALRRQTVDNEDQQARIGALETTVSGRTVLIDHAMAQFAAGDRAAAVASMRNAATLFHVQEVIDSIVKDEDGLLDARREAATRRLRNNQWVMGISALAEVLLLTIIVLVSERQIGQRLRAEASESQAVRRSQLILQAVREPIALLDAQLGILLVNNAFSELYGLPQEDRREVQPLVGVGEGAWNDGALLQRLRDVLLRDRELWDYELVQRTVDGVQRHLVINARRMQQQDGDPPVLLLTISDMTVRALAEQQVNELNRQLEGKIEQISDVNRELEAFSYSVSHDLRAPLRHIAGFAGKLEQHLGDRVDDKARHYLDVIGSAAQRMAQLIDDLLVFSRLGRGALRLQSVDMQTLVSEARALVEPDADERRIEWKISPLPVVVGDENMLRTVWQNLLGNAVKYTGQCEVARIGVDVKRNDRGDYEFTVSDNGAGFDMQYADKLFGVFQRLHRASEFPGNGIGLANVRRIIARHGGKTWAEAEPGKGASFHFSMPVEAGASTKSGIR
ncbi:histidine kinase [Frateuria sp. Soil773]|uniref:sensor histidine kinase n=1 Tax=Frateuria sp. Soil773 TaxID=1736407 RepID=UPI0006F3438C|nr:ATP-binding protein [Frateuria sp. Soil773]KRE88729.1 histidine kinase [Frateuria sp. Soil773]